MSAAQLEARFRVIQDELDCLRRQSQLEGGFLTSDVRCLHQRALWRESDAIEAKLDDLEMQQHGS